MRSFAFSWKKGYDKLNRKDGEESLRKFVEKENIRQHREEKTLTKEIVRLLVIGERKKKTTVTLKQDEIKKYFPPEYDEQKIRTVICQLLEEWSNQNH